MKIEKIEIFKLKPATYNPRQISKKQFKDLQESIQKFGLVDPIIVNKDMTVIGGHQRLKCCAEIEGFEKVPCVVLDLPKDVERELNIRLNKSGGEFDMDILANEFELTDLIDWGFKHVELGLNIDKITQSNEQDDEIPQIVENRTKEGQVWELGEHRLMCGDSTDETNVNQLMKGELADMIYTDPPYGVSYKATNFEIIENDKLRGEPLYDLLYKAFKNMFNYTSQNPGCYTFHASKTQMIFETALNDCGFEVKEQLIWNKGMNMGRADYHWSHEPCFYFRKTGNNNEWFGSRKNTTVLRKDIKEIEQLKKKELIDIIKAIKKESTVWEIKRDSVRTYLHPTQKPVDLISKAIMNNTTPNGIVMDLFLGSGSSIIGAEKTNRRCFGMELDPNYCDIVIKRWETYTGLKAKLCG